MSGKTGVLMQKTVQALREKDVDFYYFNDGPVIYMQGNSMLMRHPVYPCQIKTQIRFLEHGLLLEAGLSLRLNEQAKGKKRILEKIASLNFARMYGGLVYLPESQELRFRLFYDIENPAKDFLTDELMMYLTDVADGLSAGYDAILNHGDDTLREMEELLHIQEMVREVLDYIKAHNYKLPAWFTEMDSEEDADGSAPQTEPDDPERLSARLDRLLGSEEDA